MKEVKLNGEIVGIFHKRDEWKEGIDFLTPNETFIQTGTWWYEAGRRLKAHVHIENERVVERTQETVVVLSGRLRIDLYDEERNVFHEEELTAGDIGIILTVGHGYQILEDNTKVVEAKNGPFASVEKDKESLF